MLSWAALWTVTACEHRTTSNVPQRLPVRAESGVGELRFEPGPAKAARWIPIASAPGDGLLIAFDKEGRPTSPTLQGPAADCLDTLHSYLWLWEIPTNQEAWLSIDLEQTEFPTPTDPNTLPTGLHAFLASEFPDPASPSLTEAITNSRPRTPLKEKPRPDSTDNTTYRLSAGKRRIVAVTWNGQGSPVAGPHDIRVEELVRTSPGNAADPEFHPVKVLRQSRHAWRSTTPSAFTWSIDVPEGAEELQTGIAVLHRRHQEWGQTPVEFTITANGNSQEPLFRRVVAVRQQTADLGWQQVAISVKPWVGRRVDLRFSAQGHVDSPDEIAWARPMLVGTRSNSERPSVILVSIDTLRPDRLGCYGASAPVSPHLDEYAAQAVVFDSALSASTFTLPSHATMLTGQHPLYHRINRNPLSGATDRTAFLAEILREQGYVTAAFSGGGFVSAEFGFDRGFDLYSELDLIAPIESQPQIPVEGAHEFNARYRSSHRIEDALEWIEAQEGRPFFLFLHTFLVHSYRPSEEARLAIDPEQRRTQGLTRAPRHAFGVKNRDAQERSPEYVDALSALYEATILMLDQELKKLFEQMGSLGLDDELVFLLTSDHGEEFGEHAGLGHGRTVYDETIRVPWILDYPGAPGGTRVDEPVWLMDVVPTILDLTGIAPPSLPIHGTSVLPLLQGGTLGDRRVLVENRCQLHWERYALRGPFEKIIWNRAADLAAGQQEYEWFDLRSDSSEQFSRFEADDPNCQRRIRALDQALSAFMQGSHSGSALARDDELIGELMALGYAFEGE